MRNKPGGKCVIISADPPYHYLIGKETTSIRLVQGSYGRMIWEIDEFHWAFGYRLHAPDHALMPIDPPSDGSLDEEGEPINDKGELKCKDTSTV